MIVINFNLLPFIIFVILICFLVIAIAVIYENHLMNRPLFSGILEAFLYLLK